MKRTVPLLITALGGFVLIIAYFIPAGQAWGEVVAVWFDILASIAFLLGGGNLVKVHLKKVSDQAAGWGYSAVTLVAFFATLLIGFLKLGAAPAAHAEKYGTVEVHLALEEMPVFSVPGEIPVRGDHKRLPDTASRQLSEEAGQLTFRGWMSPDQQSDLLDWEDTLEWRAAIEALAEAASPPAAIAGKATYDPGHQRLGYTGFMSEEDEASLREALAGASGSVSEAITRLAAAAREPHAWTFTTIPESFAIPSEAAGFVTRDGETLTVLGPITPALRDQLAIGWTSPERVRPFSESERDALLAAIEEHGPALTESQREAAEAYLRSMWTPEQLIAALNTAGLASPGKKSYRQLLEEKRAGIRELDPELPAGPSVVLTAAQEDAIHRFATDPALTEADLIEAMGDLTPAQRTALARFLGARPTIAERNRTLWEVLLKAPPTDGRPSSLSKEQTDFLLDEYRARQDWQRQVHEFFYAAHTVKFPWAGEYNANGSAFWWIYEYVFQPLTATLFALLAFYVASAAFRAFRAKNVEAILLLGTAFIILMSQTAAGAFLTAWVPDSLSALRADDMKRYIMSIFNLAGNRAIMIGIALGIAATSLKILLGVDRSYLGNDD